MTAKDKIREFYQCKKSECFFAFTMKRKFPKIVAYSNFDREIILKADGIIRLGGEKERKTVNSIGELKKVMQQLVTDVEEICYNEILANSRNKNCSPLGNTKYYSDFRPQDIEHLINQLVFDVLYDKHRSDTEMTLNEYCEKHFYIYCDNESHNVKWKNALDLRNSNPKAKTIDKYIDPSISAKDSAYHNMDRWLAAYAKKMREPRYCHDLFERGLCPDLFDDYINQKNRPGKKM